MPLPSLQLSQIYPLFGALAAGSVAAVYCSGKTAFSSPDVQCVIMLYIPAFFS
jgi:hypothetical protein